MQCLEDLKFLGMVSRIEYCKFVNIYRNFFYYKFFYIIAGYKKKRYQSNLKCMGG